MFRDRHPAPPTQLVAPNPVQHCQITGYGLRSAMPGFEFRLSCGVSWQQVPNPAEPHPDPQQLAMHTVVQQAISVAAGTTLTNRDALQTHLAGELGMARPDASGQLRAWADSVLLEIDDADLAAVRKHQQLRRDKQVWERERDLERSQREYVTEVLKEPGSALAWWMARNPDAITDAVNMVGPLAQLSSAVNHTEVPALYQGFLPTRQAQLSWSPPPPVTPEEQLLMATHQLFGGLSEPMRALLGDKLAKTYAAYGQAELADRVRDLFAALDLSASGGGEHSAFDQSATG